MRCGDRLRHPLRHLRAQSPRKRSLNPAWREESRPSSASNARRGWECGRATRRHADVRGGGICERPQVTCAWVCVDMVHVDRKPCGGVTCASHVTNRCVMRGHLVAHSERCGKNGSMCDGCSVAVPPAGWLRLASGLSLGERRDPKTPGISATSFMSAVCVCCVWGVCVLSSVVVI